MFKVRLLRACSCIPCHAVQACETQTCRSPARPALQMGVLVPGGDRTAVKRTADFFLTQFTERLEAQVGRAGRFCWGACGCVCQRLSTGRLPVHPAHLVAGGAGGRGRVLLPGRVRLFARGLQSMRQLPPESN